MKAYDVTAAIIAFENRELSEEKVIELFQYLVDTGLAWQLQGSYGRQPYRSWIRECWEQGAKLSTAAGADPFGPAEALKNFD